MDSPAVCPSCQTPLIVASQFCSRCGRSVASTAPAGSAAELQLAQVRSGLADRYAVARVIGVGGMATVYLAQDRKHDRPVAIKVVHPTLGAALGHERFLREIAIAARLNHPHVLLLIDSGEVDGLLYFVMPYVDGETLRARLVREGELPVTEAVRILRDVADALAYAHAHGVVHRDIKPENVLLAGRHALVADFGVAKAVRTSAAPDILTTAGLSVGTPAYMSPEQATADPQLDHRADLYALGVVGYEMLSGDLPISGKTPAEVLAAHVTRAPTPLEERRASVPPELSRLIMRCLEKRPADRWQSAEELVTRLESFTTPSAGFTPSDTAPVWLRRRRTTAIGGGVIAVVAIVAIVAAMVAVGTRDPVGAPPVPRQLTFFGDVYAAAPSPDGRSLAFLRAGIEDSSALYVRELESGQPLFRAYIGHSGFETLAWSSDGTEILYEGSAGHQEGTFRVPMLGGTPRLVSAAGGGYHLWSPDGSQLASWFMTLPRLHVLTVATGGVDTVPVLGEFDWLLDGDWSPDGDRIAVITDASGATSLRVVSLGTGRGVEVIAEPELSSVVWNQDGTALYYAAAGMLRKLSVKSDGSARGAPITLARLGSSPGNLRLTADGRRLVFVDEHRRVNYTQYRAGSAPSAGFATKSLTTGTADRSQWPSIAPDGRSIAFAQQGPRGGGDLFRLSLDDGALAQVTFTGRVEVRGGLAWSADAKRLAFITRDAAGRRRVAVTSVDGSGSIQVYGETQPSDQMAWAPNRQILYQWSSNRNFRLLDPATSLERPLLPTDSAGWLFTPAMSPDGRRAAVLWNRRPAPAVRGTWAIPFDGAPPELITSTYGTAPTGWSSDGAWLHAFHPGEGTLVRLSVPGGRTSTLGKLRPNTAGCASSDRPNGLFFVCSEFDQSVDAWVLVDFDRNRRGGPTTR